VLVLYTPQAAAGAGGTAVLWNQINEAVVEANTVFQNSRVSTRIYLANVAQINYSESGSVSNDLARLANPNDSVFKTAHALRNQYQADLVCLITETGSDYDFYGLQGPSAENAFSILRQPFLTGLNYLPVVLSFNFGCQLERPYADSAAALPYGYGYSFYDNNAGVEYSTVDAFSGVRLPAFSNPDIQYDGQALGIPTGEANPCDNALVLNQTTPIVAAFYGPARQTMPPAISINFPATNDTFYSGTNLTLTATASDPAGTVTSVAWYFDVTNEIASVTTAPYSAVWHNLPIGVHTLIAVATDNQHATTVSAPVEVTILPGNDNFASRWAIGKLPASFSEDNTLATAEPGEPDNNGTVPQHSLWWTWTAPADTYVAIVLATNSFPLSFSVYTGSSLTNLSLVVANGFGQQEPQQLFFRAKAGTTYQITADGQFGWGPGNVAFTLTPVTGPANDDFANRTPLSGSNLTINAHNLYASHEPGEPKNGGASGNASVWYAWTAPTDGQVTLTSISQLGTLPVGFYTGTVLTNLAPVPCETGGNQELYGDGESLVFAVQAGVTYQIAFDNDLDYVNIPGPFTFNLGFVGVPSNDNFAQRTVISGSWISLTNNSLLATLEPAEPGDGSGNPSIWWSWTAPAAGLVTVTSPLGDDLLVYTGNSLTNLTYVTLDSTGTFYATPGTAYAIAAYGPPGEAALNLVFSTVRIASPANHASYFLGATIPLTASTTANDGSSLQVQYFANGQPVGAFNKRTPFLVNWAPAAAGTYVLTATATDSLGHQRSSPPVTIWVQYPSPANDNFANRAPLTGTWFDVTYSNLGATSEPGEPAIGGGYTNSIWWQWTAPDSGVVTLTANSGNYYYDYQAVYTGTSLTQLTLITNGPTFAAVAGTTYDIGVVGPPGSVELKLSLSNLQITSPTNGQVFTNGCNLTLQAQPTATETPVQQIQYYVNGYYPLTVSNSPYAFILTNVPGGNYTVTAVAYDKLGHDRSSPVVNFSVQPANDNFANRLKLSGSNILLTNSTANAQAEAGDPPFLANQGNGIIWWQWTAPASGWVTLSVPNDDYFYFAYLGVYAGNSLSYLQTVVESYAPTGFTAVAGATYNIGAAVEFGPIALQLILSNVQITSPTNGEAVTGGTNLLFSVDASSVLAPVSEVDFYTNNARLGVATSPPYSILWTNVYYGNYTLTAVAVDNQGLTWPARPVSLSVVPPNDDFTHRPPLTGMAFSVAGTTAGAGWEAGEPGLHYESQDQTVWYTWTAPADNVYYFNLASDNGFGQLAVYTGTSLADLSLVASNTFYSSVPAPFTATAGTTYQIQLDALYDDDFTLDLQPVPTNTTIASAIPLTGTNLTVIGDDTYGGLYNSVWYSWTAPDNGEATVTTSPNGSVPYVLIYTGASISNLTSVASGHSTSFTPVTGVTYWIEVESGPGPFSLNLNFIPAPGNDSFANRTPLSGLNVTVTGTTLYATVEPGEPNLTGLESIVNGVWANVSPSVWYAWTAPASGYVRIQPPQAYLGVFSGNVVSNLTTVGVGGYGEEVDFDAVAGQTYPISVVQVSWGQDAFTWSLQMAKVAITNPVEGAILPAGTNLEVDASTIDMEGAVTSVAFFANSNLLSVAANPPFSTLLTNLNPGDYVLSAQATDQFGGVTTSKTVEIRVPPGNDNFAQRIVFTGTNTTLSGDDSGATIEPGECLPAGASGRTIWWSWTAPINGNVTINSLAFSNNVVTSSIVPEDVIVTGPGFPQPPGPTSGPLLAVYTGSILTNLSLCASNTAYYSGYGPVIINPSGPVYPLNWCVVSPISFPVVAGQTYQISLDGVNGSFGAASINFFFSPLPPPPPAPPNDNFAQRTILTGGSITTNGTTVGATLELTDPDLGAGLDARTVWYSWTAPASGTVALNVLGPYEYNDFYDYPSYPPYGVYAGSTPGSLIPLATGDSVGDAYFYALAGTTYQIEVATPNESEVPFTLTLTAPLPPALSPAPPVRLANGSYDLRVIGSKGQSFVLQSSLNGTTWTTIDTDTLLAASLDYVDTTPIRGPARYYRLLPLDTVLNNQRFQMQSPTASPASGFALHLTGASGTPFLIQTSTNLLDWFNLTSGVLTGNTFNYTDFDAPNHPRRFYRTLPQ